MIERERLKVSGVVQGVGFRPFVWRLAQRLNLSGEIRNGTHGVHIDIQGERRDLDAFGTALTTTLPPLARIAAVQRTSDTPDPLRRHFQIANSTDDAKGQSRIPADSTLCDACLDELFDEGGRRWRHPFICCTDCGPRFTLTHRTPYDRAHTSMAAFLPCARCAAEYGDPADRRFHSETIACPDCGPRLRFRYPGMGASHAELDGQPDVDPVALAWAAISRGEIVAVEGLGGFQLICDATNPAAVARLRQRKRRPTKPLALLVPNLASAAQWVDLADETHANLLALAARPIVVLPRLDGQTLTGVAPGLNRLGVMLPSTPVQYLLFHQALGQPGGTQWLGKAQPAILVATSANRSGEPLVADPGEAGDILAGIADAILDHDRRIAVRCDDSVVLAARSSPAVMLRRARGYVPEPVPLPADGPSVLALGAQKKCTVTLTAGRFADVSPYLGDLGNPNVCELLEETVERYLRRQHSVPDAVACDRQPDLYSTRVAERLALHWNVPLLRVQHHHAHVAAVLAENGHTGPALGLALDGFGWGDDGGAWGGELLLVENGHARRLGHLSPLPLPGADAAARAPWRMAAALLHTLEPGAHRPLPTIDATTASRLYRQIERGFNCPTTTSLGRWFDAIAGLAGICPAQQYEGEAAMKLEALSRPAPSYAQGWRIDGFDLDLLPLARRLVDVRDPAEIASNWHATLAAALGDWLCHAMRATGIRTIALAGGCCANPVLISGLRDVLRYVRCTLLQARSLPPGDEAISYGQAWAAIQQLQSPAVPALHNRSK
ncbi:carbamoyltransferase HypF [Paraburkholderia adhaesiva]|uniref:carbamoyltransferase HypF n=1 Tax=Paraburkholderia adhaesiva TaxID=2883244 RepID=UPI001F3A3C35|nr:carbamoyltransferase HypF [Paraburkholderia adhaesiva]